MNIVYEKLAHNYIISNLSLVIMYFISVLFTFPLESVLLPRLYGKLFEKIKTEKTHNDVTNVLENIKSFNVGGIIVLVSLVWLTVTLGHSFKHSIESKLIPNYLHFIRNEIFSSVIKNKSKDFSDVKTGDMITRILDVSRFIRYLFQWSISKFLPEIIGLISVLTFSFFIDKNIGFILLTGIIILTLITYFGGKEIVNFSKEREKGYYAICEKMSDNFNNLINIFINNQDDKESKNNSNMHKDHSNVLTKQMVLEKNIVLLMQIISIIVYSCALFYAYKQYSNNKIKASLFITTILILGNYLSYLVTMNHSIISHICGTYGNIMASKDFLEEILQPPNSKNHKDFVTNGNIKFENIDFYYTKNKYVFKDFSMKINGNSKTAVVGSSGSGKSSLMKMLILLNKPQNGKITIDGVDISESDYKYLRSQISYVNQKTNLFNKSVLENMMYGNKDISEKTLTQIIQRYELDSVFAKLKNGIYSNSGVNGNNLSGGMQKITILLRGILKPSKIIVFDEPLAGLDPTTRSKVMKMINEQCKNKTVIVITHEKEILTYMDQVINLNKFKQV